MTSPTDNVRSINPSKTCAWCRIDFTTVPELLDHVVDAHLDDTCVA
jgi:hypothetical protein